MKGENVIQRKSYLFALQIVQTYKFLREEKKPYSLADQLLRSGTSIAANIEEALGGQSTKDFYAKLTIAYKEARETRFWLRLLRDSSYLEKEKCEPLLELNEEILRIIGAIQKTIKETKLQSS